MANQISGLFQKLAKNPKVMQMAEQMFGSMNRESQKAFLSRPNIMSGLDARKTVDIPVEDLIAGKTNGSFGSTNNPEILFDQLLHDNPDIPLNGTPGFTGNAGDFGALALGAAKAHPFKTAGLVGLGAGNIGGLIDNNKFGGQLAGLGLGGLSSYLMGANPYAAAMMTMGGGELGSLFDKLRARKEQEQAEQAQFYGR